LENIKEKERRMNTTSMEKENANYFIARPSLPNDD
jgi:hypothetical protein